MSMLAPRALIEIWPLGISVSKSQLARYTIKQIVLLRATVSRSSSSLTTLRSPLEIP
jgi:hypothetical protein